jgi:hypothetical protein
MADILKPLPGPQDYTSIYSDINYSKGPKVLYGDPSVFQVILNDAQTDSDDEWGGTEEIALRMMTDELTNLHKSVFGWSTILGLADEMQILVNYFVGLQSSNFLNPQNAILTIGNTQLASGSLLLSTGTSFSPTLLSMNGGSFTIAPDPTTGVAGSIIIGTTNGTPNVTMEMIPSSTSPTFTISVTSASTTGVYTFTPGSFSLSGVAFYATSGTFGILTGGVMTGTSLSLTSNLTFPTSTSGSNPLSNYIIGTAGGTADMGDTLTLTSNNIELLIKTKTPVVPYATTSVLFYSVSAISITLILNSYVNILQDLTLSTNLNSTSGIINFLAAPNTSTLTVFNDGVDVRWLITGAKIFDFGGTIRGGGYGVRLWANGDYGVTSNITGIEFSGITSGQTIDMSMTFGTVMSGSVYGLILNTVAASVSTGFIINNMPFYLNNATTPTNNISLDTNFGISTGQNSIKWKTVTFTGVSWNYTLSPNMAYVDLTSLGLTALGVTVLSIETTVSVPALNVIYTPGADTYYTEYDTTSKDLLFNKTTGSSSVISANTVNVSVIVFYTQA